MEKSVIITGASGMVGRGVLLECLDSDKIQNVLVINRSTINMNHPKLKEILLKDFTQISSIKDQLKNYDGCFYCMGVSVVGLDEATYSKITFETTKAFADVLYEANPNMVFNYISGTGTDSSEKGSSMWARVKGKTENMFFAKGFRKAYAFRPGIILPEKGIKSKTGWYNALYVITRPFFPLMKKSTNITTTTKLGQAMINSLTTELYKNILENKDINKLSEG